MEDLFFRYPNLTDMIFEYLDNPSVTKCKEVSRVWKASIENQRSFWIRIIKCRVLVFGCPDAWKSMLHQSPISLVRKMGLEILSQPLNLCMDAYVVPTPYDFAASFGNLELFQMIYQRIEEKNLQELFKESKPFSEAAVHGHYDLCKFIMENFDNVEMNPIWCEDKGNTLLQLAADEGYFNVCELIIENVTGVNIFEWEKIFSI